MDQVGAYDYTTYTARDVRAALEHETCSVEDFKALLSPAAAPFLEEMAGKAQRETQSTSATPSTSSPPSTSPTTVKTTASTAASTATTTSSGWQLNKEQIEHEMKVIADSGMEEILMLTGESRAKSSVEYIGEAVKIARKYFRMIGLEIYPVNTDEYRYLRDCGADYVTVFQETYDADKYETLHLKGHKRVWPYRFEAQERALMGGMRGVGFSALLGLADFRKDALATALHVYYLQRKYPHAEMSLSCPRLRPIVNNDQDQSPGCPRKRALSDPLRLSHLPALCGHHRLLPRERQLPGRHREDRRHKGLRRRLHRHRRPREQVHRPGRRGRRGR